MKRSRLTEEQIIGMLKQQEAGMSMVMFYKFKMRCGGLEVSDARRLRRSGTRAAS